MTRDTARQGNRRWSFGPGLLVTAAFIGPGTVTTASQAGAEYGLSLIWTILLAVITTIVLQEMAARLGLVTRQGLAEAIRHSIASPWLRNASLALILTAIVLGNTAYQTGNLIGAGVGIHCLTGLSVELSAAVLGLAVVAVFAIGSSSRVLSKLLVAIVLAMSVAFLATAISTRPNLVEVVKGTVFWSVPSGAELTAIALIGTTVVPYNLFLHATAVQSHWPADLNLSKQVRHARIDTVVAIAIGGIVTMAILATSAAVFHDQGISPFDIAAFTSQLEPLLGQAGRTLFALGLVAAGLTSAITAPLAAGYTLAGVFPKAAHRSSTATAISVAIAGCLLAGVFGKSPQATIVIAQAANGLLLPLVAIFLLVVMNRRDLLGNLCNGLLLNIVGVFVVIAACGLGMKSLWMLTR